MKTVFTTTGTPEENELIVKRADLDRLSALLVEKELAIEDIRMSVANFQHRYFAEVGRKYVELDALRAQLAERQSRHAPADMTLKQTATDAREEANRSAQEYRETKARPEPTLARGASSDEARSLYRKIAAIVHPDKTTEENTRQLRTKLMVALNEAYARRDISRMRSLLAEWEHSPDAVEGAGTAIDLVRTIRAIAQIRRRITDLDGEIEEIYSSDIHALMVRIHDAELDNRDILSQMAVNLDAQIQELADRIKAIEQ